MSIYLLHTTERSIGIEAENEQQIVDAVNNLDFGNVGLFGIEEIDKRALPAMHITIEKTYGHSKP